MAETESLRQIAQTRAPLSAWFGVLLLFALFGVIVLAVIGPSPRGNKYEETRAKNRVDKLKANHDEDTKSLSTYAWIDKNKGTVRIPIERAMELTVAQLAQQKPMPAGPIATPTPPAAAAPAPATASPAPSASPQASATPKATTVSGIDSQNRGQPAGASNPPGAKPGTQPGAAASPAASPPAPAAKSAASPSPVAAPTIAPSATPLPVRGKDSPTPTATPH